jgi:F0F1-type ATP synthase gamma subunit
MYSRSQLKKYSESVATIKSITRVYEEAAARRVRLIEGAVERIKEFIASCADTYLNIKFGLIARKNTKEHLSPSELDLSAKQQTLVTSFRSFKKRGVLVLISSKEEFYGNLIPSIYRNWKKDLAETGFDGIVLGNTGKRLLEKDKYRLDNVKFFALDDTNPDLSLIHRIGEEVCAYQEIYVYYGQYRTVLTQTASQSKISSSIAVGQVQEVKRYLFESDPKAILQFFEKEVIKALLQEKIYQSQKAKYAARIKILEIGQVAEKMSEILSDLDRGRRKVNKAINNKKQLQLYTGSDLWSEEE